MRVIFNEELKQVADDLDRMAQNVRKAIKGAGEALLNQDVEAAQTVIDGDIEIDALESSVIDQCFLERLGDHAVSAARRVVYIVSGFDPTKEPTRDEGTDID